MFADACKIISIVAVIWFKNKGLAIVLLVILSIPVRIHKNCTEEYAGSTD